jgi:hypothetical protein
LHKGCHHERDEVEKHQSVPTLVRPQARLRVQRGLTEDLAGLVANSRHAEVEVRLHRRIQRRPPDVARPVQAEPPPDVDEVDASPGSRVEDRAGLKIDHVLRIVDHFGLAGLRTADLRVRVVGILPVVVRDLLLAVLVEAPNSGIIRGVNAGRFGQLSDVFCIRCLCELLLA